MSLTPNNRKKRNYYLGNLSASDFANQEKAERSLRFVRAQFISMRRHVKNLSQKCNRHELKIKNLESMVEHLEKKVNLLGPTPQTAGPADAISRCPKVHAHSECISAFLICKALVQMVYIISGFSWSFSFKRLFSS